MNTADIAIVISIFSAVLASVSLGWNIYRDVLLKARLDIVLGIRTLMTSNSEERPQYVIISITNHGPGFIIISMIQWKKTSLFKWVLRKRESGLMLHDYENPLSGQLPKKLDVGEKVDLLFPYDAECMLKENWSHIGIFDTFGRSHWANKKHVTEANKKWKTDYG